MTAPACAAHADAPSVAPCTACRTPLCDACAAFTIGGQLACARCAAMAARAGRLRLDFAGVFLLAGGSALYGMYTAVSSLPLAGLVGAVMLISAVYLAAPRGKKKEVAPRLPASSLEERQVGGGTSAYRGSARIERVRPPGLVSGRTTALLLLGTFAATGLALPFSMRLPRWIEWEIIFAVWGSFLAVTLTTLLYRGWRVTDDHRFVLAPGGEKDSESRLPWHWLNGLDGAADPEGCLFLVLMVLFIVASVVAAWLIVELVFPFVFFVAYWLVMKAVARVANDKHDCRGHLGRALLWGTGFSLLYTAPLAALVAIAHALIRAKAGG